VPTTPTSPTSPTSPSSTGSPSPSSCCFLDPTRPCGLCAAPAQELCPYPYLLGYDEPDRTSRESGAVQAPTAGPSSLT
jgi:hypothetical protein